MKYQFKAPDLVVPKKIQSRNNFWLFVLSMIVITLNPMAPSFAGDACTHVDLAWIAQHVSLPVETKILLKQEQGSLCETVLSIEGDLVPMYAGKNAILVGKLFKKHEVITQKTLNNLKVKTKNDQSREHLETENRKRFFAANYQKLNRLSSVSFNARNGRNPLFVLTDPNCPHCKELMPALERAVIEAGLELKLIVYPLLGEQSRDMAMQAICGNYSLPEYKNSQHSETVVSCAKANTLLKETESFLGLAEISFVPIVIAGDGSWIVEGNGIKQVRHYLGLENGSEENSSVEACKSE